MPTTLFQVKNVKKHYPIKGGILRRTKSEVKAVNGVSLEITKGETLGVVGESGCGKSTLGRAILGLEPLTEGQLIFADQDITQLSRRQLKPFKREMQMIFQDPYASLNPRQRIGAAIEEAIKIHNPMNAKQRREKVLSLLEEVGLKREHYGRFPHEFSGGQRQRIGIARALALQPSFIVCDEAVSALDVSVQAQVLNLLKKLQSKYELTYLFISHDLGVVRYISDRVLVMYLGNMVELAPSEALYENPVHPYTQALLSAIPRTVPNKERERIKLMGEIPSPTDPPKGCAFHTRCPIATELCSQSKPEWRAVGEGHYAACHYVGEELNA
ncbi:oligopeptide/dipeptide ABC transporter ATP-binding protein [Pullulanibacillus pueri]|uniref:ABC transporter ATP-binding protein n=1 Tax=Pullulanibacillus pueri TaxID=1437324 RepID=A0A8J2ZX13_9BACL|nr:dipeptide ABC transporter ATP-binding protein [Pullulanibacillus pueri]MBM7681750.1 oligopeptide/dipeptide ABC transporter ATP-binding protein [Pullulanibacillus pueri]GGH84134.1 ABC transporter ATP-binding protein [Pullulanibacillus pueri]